MCFAAAANIQLHPLEILGNEDLSAEGRARRVLRERNLCFWVFTVLQVNCLHWHGINVVTILDRILDWKGHQSDPVWQLPPIWLGVKSCWFEAPLLSQKGVFIFLSSSCINCLGLSWLMRKFKQALSRITAVLCVWARKYSWPKGCLQTRVLYILRAQSCRVQNPACFHISPVFLFSVKITPKNPEHQQYFIEKCPQNDRLDTLKENTQGISQQTKLEASWHSLRMLPATGLARLAAKRSVIGVLLDW